MNSLLSVFILLACVATTESASAVEDLMTTIKIIEGHPLNIVMPWGRSVKVGVIETLTFLKNKLDLSPESIEVTADEKGVTLKATKMTIDWRARAGVKAVLLYLQPDIEVSGTIDRFEQAYAYGAPLNIEAKDCSIAISDKKAEVSGIYGGMVEPEILAKIDAIICPHIYFFGSVITQAVNEVGFANLKAKSGKGAAGIRAMFGK